MKNRTFLKIYLPDLLFFTIAFIIFTPIGTVSHEAGHIMAAKILGYETRLQYSSMNWNAEKLKKELDILYLENEQDILNKEPFEDKARFDLLLSKFKRDSLICTLGGPLQTMLTGTIGFLFLYFRKNTIRRAGFRLTDWLGVFLALFWLREVFNLSVTLFSGIFGSRASYFGGDELRISTMLNLPEGSIPILSGLTGLWISLYVIFRIIPLDKRLTFIISGLTGVCVGLYLWINVLGPKLLP